MAFYGIHFIDSLIDGRDFEQPVDVRCHGLSESMGIVRTFDSDGWLDIHLAPARRRRRILVAFEAAHHYQGGLQIRYFTDAQTDQASRTISIEPGPAFVDCFDENVVRCRVVFPANFSVNQFSIGICAAKPYEFFLANHPKLRTQLRKVRALYQLANRGIAHVKRNGLNSASIGKAWRALQQLNARPVHLRDPARAVFGYAAMPTLQKLPLNRVHIGVSSSGNFFMKEIAYLIGDAFTELSFEVSYFDERTPPDPDANEIALVVAPHEFFVLDCPTSTFRKLQDHPRFVVLNTEQAQTQWFAKALKFLRSAKLVLDMSYQTAILLQFNNIPAVFLPLGYSERYQARFPARALLRKGPLRGIPEDILSSFPGDYKQRPIDILFVGTESTRRKAFFSRYANVFAAYRCFIYIPSGTDPFHAGAEASIEFDQLIGLCQRSKIVLNIHRDEDRYLEWQRVVNIGVFSGAKVISETCESNPLLTPGLHYVDAPLEDIAVACTRALADIEDSERFAARASSDLARHTRLSTLLSKLPWK